MDKLKQLMALCKCGIGIEINDHRNAYESIGHAMDEWDSLGHGEDIAPEVRAKIIETDTLIDLHFYPDTPIGFYKILHYDLDAALDQALECLQPTAKE